MILERFMLDRSFGRAHGWMKKKQPAAKLYNGGKKQLQFLKTLTKTAPVKFEISLSRKTRG